MADVKIIKIPKNDGSYRTIYMPQDPEHIKILKQYTDVFSHITLPPHVCAFVKSRNIVKYVKPHLIRLKAKHAISVDIYKCFDSIRKNIILKGLDRLLANSKEYNIDNKIKASIQKLMDHDIDLCLYKGFLPQGFHTSPFLSNVALLGADEKIMNDLREYKFDDLVYTRYADNMLLSSFKIDSFGDRFYIVNMINNTLKDYGLHLNTDKTKYYINPNNGHIKLCGISIRLDDLNLRTPKRIRHLYRGVLHACSNAKKPKLNKLKGLYGFMHMVESRVPKKPYILEKKGGSDGQQDNSKNTD